MVRRFPDRFTERMDWNVTERRWEKRDREGKLHNGNGPAIIKPMGNGTNKVEFYLNGEQMTREAYFFLLPNAAR